MKEVLLAKCTSLRDQVALGRPWRITLSCGVLFLLPLARGTVGEPNQFPNSDHVSRPVRMYAGMRNAAAYGFAFQNAKRRPPSNSEALLGQQLIMDAEVRDHQFQARVLLVLAPSITVL